MTSSRAVPRRDRVAALVLGLGVVALLGIRLHVLDDDFPNPDLAGIVYNAELVLDGGRPYVDTVEIKPPGAFLMAAGAIALLGRSLEALQLVHGLWLVLGGLGVWWAARAIHDRDDDERLGPRCAAIATAVYLVGAAMFSYNYSSWMTPASALAVGMALRGLRGDRFGWQVGAGALALVAFVTIQRAAVLGVVLPGLWLWARRRGWAGARPRVPAGWVLGAGLGLLPLLGWYADAPGELWRGLVPLAVGLDYASASASSGSPLVAIAAALGQLVTVFWFPVGVVMGAGLATWRERPRELAGWVPGALWLVASVVGAGLGGMRFYLHYLVQYAPALGLLAGHPALVRLGARALAEPSEGRGRARGLLAMVMLLVVAQLLEIGAGEGHRYEAMARRLRSGQTAAQAAGAHIRARTREGEPVLAWGWTAWRVYYWAQRRSPSRIYKPLGSVTTFNDNTQFDPGHGVRFREGPLADELVEAFDRDPPAYFVYSPSMVHAFGARTEPLEQFEALRRRLEQGYVAEAQYGDLRLLRRHAPAPAR